MKNTLFCLNCIYFNLKNSWRLLASTNDQHNLKNQPKMLSLPGNAIICLQNSFCF